MTELWRPPVFRRLHPKAAVGCVVCSVCGRRMQAYRSRLTRTELRSARHKVTGLAPKRDPYDQHCPGSFMPGQLLGKARQQP